MSLGPWVLAFEEKAEKPFTSLNILREEKPVFELLRAFYSMKAGRHLRHWEAFNMMLADVLAFREEELRSAGFRRA